MKEKLSRLNSYFTTYEKVWYFSILILAIVFAIIFPEEDTNGINGSLIMALYLFNIFTNITCELLISKQSKWNFIVSLFVEISEILIYVLLMYRFATMAATILFWIPVDIVSFVIWRKHPDREEKELTIVRSLKGWQEVLVIALIAIWTIVVGSFIAGLDVTTELFNGRDVEILVSYLDALASALGIANGLFILFRYKEQWIAWYLVAILEAVINILAGQYVLLILKLGYLTNTTYGFIKWTRYIKTHSEENNENIPY